MFVSGFLPFAAAHFQLSGLHGLHSTLCITLVMTILISTTVGLVFTFLSLNSEEHKWWLRSFLNGGSVGLFLLLFCISFLANMEGSFQTTVFLLYSILVAFGVMLMTGYASFVISLRFVIFIYSRIKSD